MCVCVCIYIFAHPQIYGKKTYCNKNAASHLGLKKIKTFILI